MKGKNGTLIIASVITLVMLAGVLSLAARSSGKSTLQEQTQIEEKRLTRQQVQNEPFELTELKIKEARVKLGEKFRAEGKWLKDIELKFKNTADKPITLIMIGIDFPETKTDKPMMFHQMVIGQRVTHKGDLLGNPILLIQNDTITVKLSESECEDIDQFLGTRGYSIAKLTKAHFRIHQIHFSDGSIWVNGVWHIPDQSSPGGYRRVGQP